MAATSKGKSKKHKYCSGGKHNPKASHPEKDCWQLTKRTANAAQATESDDAGSRLSSAGFRCVIKALAATQNDRLSYLDSGASHHMFADKKLFSDYHSRNTKVEITDGNTLSVEGNGFVHIITESRTSIKLKAIHVPQISTTLISLGQLLEHGCEIKHTGQSSFNIIHNDVVFFKASIVSGTCMVRIRTTRQGQSVSSSPILAFSATDIDLLHRRAGHCGNKALKHIYGIKLPKIKCDAFSMSKSH